MNEFLEIDFKLKKCPGKIQNFDKKYPDKIFLPEHFLKEISNFKNIYIELSGGYHSSNTVLLFYELGFKNIFLIHNDTKLQYLECLENIQKLIFITGYPINFITTFHKRKISDILKTSFRNIDLARGKSNYRDYFDCCRILKKQSSKSWFNANLLNNSIVISSLCPYESFNRQMTLFDLKKQDTYLRFHKTQNVMKGYPYRDLLIGHRNFSRNLFDKLFEIKMKKYDLNISHSGCRICPIRIMNPKLLNKNDCSIKYNKIING